MAIANGYFVIIATSHELYEHEKRNIENLVNMRVEGIIACLSQETTDYRHFTTLSDINMPVVLFDRVCLPELFSTVVADGVQSAQKLRSIYWIMEAGALHSLAGPIIWT